MKWKTKVEIINMILDLRKEMKNNDEIIGDNLQDNAYHLGLLEKRIAALESPKCDHLDKGTLELGENDTPYPFTDYKGYVYCPKCGEKL